MRRTICLLFAIVALFTLQAHAADWPQFRGPTGDGVSSEMRVPITWDKQKNVRWKAPLPGPGNSSPIVSAGRVFITCAEDKGRKRSLYCIDRNNGKQLWVRAVEHNNVAATHKTNPYCASTPLADGKRVVVWHGSAGLFCYDFEGKELWQRDLGQIDHAWGYAASPVLYRDHILLNRGPGKGTTMMALEMQSGKTVWETEESLGGDGKHRKDGANIGTWCTPIVVKVDGKDQILCAMPTRVNAYDPETGKIIWSCEGLAHQRGDLVYSSAGRGQWTVRCYRGL